MTFRWKRRPIEVVHESSFRSAKYTDTAEPVQKAQNSILSSDINAAQGILLMGDMR